MARPIVHIGYHKTATTWFQKAFYPSVANYAYVDRDRVKQAFLADPPFAFNPEKARAILALDPQMPPILCEEGLSGYLHNGGLGGYLTAEVARRIKAVLPDARIVIFIRSQPSMVASCYQQYLRGGGTYSVRRYLFSENYLQGAAAESYKVPRFSFAHFEYDRLVAYYDGLFGCENVLVVPYESFARDAAGTLAMMTAEFGLEVAEQEPRKFHHRQNQSYGAVLVPLARFLNLFTYRTVGDKRVLFHIPFWYSARRFVLERLNATGLFGAPPGPEKLLGKDVVRWIERRFAESNHRLLTLRQQPLEELGYPLDTGAELPPAPARSGNMDWLNR